MEITKVIVLFVLVLGILGIVFLGVGIGLYARGRKKARACTQPVTATVADLRKESVGVGNYSADGEAQLKSWFPVYEYTIGGVTHRVKAFLGTAKPEVEIGQAVELLVNPDRTDEFYCPAEKTFPIQNVFIGVGVLCLCLTAIIAALFFGVLREN